MNRIEGQRWEVAVDAARAATSSPAEQVRWRPLLQEWRERSARRRALASVPARDLRDAGLSIEAVEHELAQPFWRALGTERK